ncbi:Heme/hemopexin-binding protein [Polaromonas vacuolata]|uniref:Heme/hemopexin-binding protein n=1 Tax=Polaromonas vacuolata TaxID=37448 RepID=A0A6H2HB73_9BURK|nr:GLUG motif-containing protein [Polaromonas vacuolata]QJC57115.1 Heme/hemopexin-binding protein [Polaromonas vacuolata]
MNHIYRSIWNATVGTYVAASEVSKSAGKKNRFKRVGFALKAGVAITLSAWVSAALALPALSNDQGNLQVQVQGNAQTVGSTVITQSNNTLSITQKSQNIALNWLRFNINAGETVAFNQTGPSSVALNRVILSEPSNILGNLTANGKVFLINPAGIVFVSGATVNVGGLVASTRDITDSNFASGQMIFSGASSASVSNNGSITANSGYVALLGARVENTGTITANSGTVVLAAGNQMTLDIARDKLLGVNISEAAVNAMVQNGGQIIADGGQVLLSAQAANDLLSSAVNNTGLIQAQTLSSSSGSIKLLAGKQNGSVNVGGILDASSLIAKSGGYIETSAARVQVDSKAVLNTLAQIDSTGGWLIKTTDFTIDNQVTPSAGRGMSATILQNNLATTNIEIAAFSNSNNTETSNINVNANLSWNANKLTLTAQRDVNINAVMTANITASLAMKTASTDRIDGTDGHDDGIGTVNVALGKSGFLGRVDLNDSSTLSINVFDHTIVRNQSELQSINTNLNRHYALGDDVSLIGFFSPVGTPTNPFTGFFEGLGHKVNNLGLNPTITNRVGFFRNTLNAKIRNIGLENVDVAGSINVGALVGFNDSTDINNSYAKGSVTGTVLSIGGLVGYNKSGNISGSFSDIVVTSSDNANLTGGLVGFNEGNISRSFALGPVSAGLHSANTGGLTGYNAGNITNSFAAGAVKTKDTSRYTGGLAGSNVGTIDSSYAAGAVTTGNSSSNTGGLTGYNRDSGNINNSYATGTVTAGNASSNTGGLVGNNENMISSSYANNMVNTGENSSNIGGLTGGNSSASTISNSYSLSSVTVGDASYYYGGLIGNNESSGNTVNSFYNIDTANLSNISIGGIYNLQFQDWMSSSRRGLAIANYFNVNSNGSYPIGSLQNLKDLLGFASAAGTGYKFVLTADLDLAPLPNYTIPVFAAAQLDGAGHTLGNLHISDVSRNSGIGFVGKLSALSSISNLGLVDLDISTQSALPGSNYVGGMVGDNYGSISTSFVTGKVSGTNYVGGLVGYNRGNGGTIENSYSSATVDGDSSVGALTGGNAATGVIKTSYAAGLVTGNQSVGGLIGEQIIDPINAAQLDNNFYDASVNAALVGIGNGADSPGSVIGLSATEIRKQASFNAVGVQASNWDFVNTWLINEGQTRPVLRSFQKPVVVAPLPPDVLPPAQLPPEQSPPTTATQQLPLPAELPTLAVVLPTPPLPMTPAGPSPLPLPLPPITTAILSAMPSAEDSISASLDVLIPGIKVIEKTSRCSINCSDLSVTQTGISLPKEALENLQTPSPIEK